MANDMFKGLLDKSSSPGSTWGELAGMYFSGSRKKDNRARNVLLASLFFNAKEASMQSKVMKQLQDLEDQKELEKARLGAEFKKRTELQTLKEAIDQRGAFNYYRNEAEQAFNDAYAGEEVFAFGGADAEKFKNNWMKDWSQKFADSKLKNYNENVDPNVLTIEEFSKPTMEYFKAKRRQITRPENISLVHKMFGKLPGFGSDEEYSKLVDKYDTQRRQQATRVNAYLHSNFKEIDMDATEQDTLNNFKIDGNAFNTLASNLGLYSGTADDVKVIRLARQEWQDKGNTYKAARDAIISHQTAYDSKLNLAKMNSAERAYMDAVSKPNEDDDNYEEKLNLWEQGRKKAIRKALNIEDVGEDLRYNALQLYSIAVDTKSTKKDRDTFIKDYIDNNIRKATGEIDLSKIKEVILSARSENLLELIRKQDTNTLNDINKTALSAEVINALQTSESSIDNNLYNVLKEYKFNINLFNQDYGARKDESIVIKLRELQQSQYIQNDTKLSLIGMDAIDAAYTDVLGLNK